MSYYVYMVLSYYVLYCCWFNLVVLIGNLGNVMVVVLVCVLGVLIG